ncbi:MAG: hypothetical protein PGN22_15685 [Agrobacterium cavarae]
MRNNNLPVLVLHDRRVALTPGTVVFDRRSRKLRLRECMSVDGADAPCDLWERESGWSTDAVCVRSADIEYVEVRPERASA